MVVVLAAGGLSIRVCRKVTLKAGAVSAERDGMSV
jgi:hypothetical protein